MQVSLPIHYTINTRKKHHRSHQECKVWDFADFHIEEIFPEDAPIVIQGFDRNNKPYKDPKDQHRYGYYSSSSIIRTDPNPTGVLRYHEGSFWYPEFNSADLIVNAENWSSRTRKDDLLHTMERRFWDNLFEEAKDHKLPHELRYIVMYDEDEHRNIAESNRQEVYDFYASRISKDVRVIDGQIYHRTPEPVYALVKHHNCLQVTTLFNTNEELETGEKIEFFRLDRFDEMVEQINDFKDLFPEQFGDREIITGSRPEILMHGILEFADDERSLMRTAKLGHVSIENELKHMSRDGMVAWFDMKVALKVAGSTPEADQIEAVAEIYAKLCDQIKGMPEFDMLPANIKKFTYQADYILNRWEARDIDLALAFEP